MAIPLPTAPDFGALAQSQAQLNQQAAQQQTLANRPNQYGPQGMMTWSQGPNGQWTQNTSLSPTSQNIVDWASGGLAGAGGALDRLNNSGNGSYGQWGTFDLSGLPQMPDAGFGADQKTIDAMRGLQAPQLQAAEDARRAQLAAQGITQGSRIGDLTERELGNTRSDADMKAILAGTQEYGNVFNRGMQARQQGVSEREKSFNAANLLRQSKQKADMEQIGVQGDLINTFQNPKFGSFASATAAPPADIYGAAGDQYRAQLDWLRAGQQQENASQARSQGRQDTGMGLLGGLVQGMGGISGIGGMLSGAGSWLGGLFGGSGGGGSDALDGWLAMNDNYSGVEV